MTAFSKVKERHDGIEVSIQLQSVNKKVLDVHVKAPSEWQFFETAIRKSISSQVSRGHITVVAYVHYDTASCIHVSINMPYVLALQEGISKIAKTASYEATAEDFFKALIRDKACFEQSFDIQKDTENAFLQTLESALGALVSMKEREGELLENELLMRIAHLQEITQKIEVLADLAPRRYRDKLTQLLEEFTASQEEHQERIAKEVALLADKVDITEELQRLGFHIDHFVQVCENKEKMPAGKVLEFILQELLREVNTIGSKSQEAEIARLVILAKSEIEKMKEQVQNVE